MMVEKEGIQVYSIFTHLNIRAKSIFRHFILKIYESNIE